MRNWLALSLVALPSLAHAWSDHYLVTAAALAPLEWAQSARAPAEPITAVLPALGFSNLSEFLEAHHWRKDYDFAFRMGEIAGQPVSIAAVLAKYSDEPDWGMDKELFDEDQYPALWKSEYTMMGGKIGTPSQSFRHLYWRELDLLHPIASFKLPVQKIFGTMGEAPARADLFVSLARKAQASGHPYWAARFVSNALHYLEDLSQPFHAAQIPTKEYLWMPVAKKPGGPLVAEVQHIVEYYHFAFEDYVAKMMNPEESASDPAVRESFELALASAAPVDDALPLYDGSPARLVKKMAQFAGISSPEAGRACRGFFPVIEGDYATFDAKAALNDAWWMEVVAKGQGDSAERKKYFDVVTRSFAVLGQSVRELVTKELGPR